MNHAQDLPAYGLWSLVMINSAVFIIFAFSFFKPSTKRDWRTFGGFSAFIVALFVEMYGFPLTIYLASGWIAQRFPGIDPFSHDAGHLWYTLLGFKGNPLEPDPACEQSLHPRGISPSFGLVAGALQRAARGPARKNWTLLLGPAPARCGVHCDHARER